MNTMDPAVENIMKMTDCLVKALEVLKGLQSDMRDLHAIARDLETRVTRLETTLRNPNRFTS